MRLFRFSTEIHLPLQGSLWFSPGFVPILSCRVSSTKLSASPTLLKNSEMVASKTYLCDKETPPHIVVQNPIVRHQTRADTYFGKGTLEAVKCYLNAAEEKGEVDAVFVNTTLSGIQQRNLERLLGKPVLDRVGLIIEIFNVHACTKEGKLQAELAALMYKKTRLIRMRGPGGRLGFGMSGDTEVVSARGRGSAGAGFISGAGETELQLQRRRITERRSSLLQQLRMFVVPELCNVLLARGMEALVKV